MKGRALRRALATKDAIRIGGPEPVPAIQDATELITPEIAYDLLLRNKNNRPINWHKVEEYASVMARGEWKLHGQGILIDTDGNLLTGQKRLWAVIYGNSNVYMRVSRGNPPTVGKLIDRGDPQSARDLASRGTGHKHAPLEASIARAICSARGELRPSRDSLAVVIERNAELAAELLEKTIGTKKTRAVLMILAAMCLDVPLIEMAELVKRIGTMEFELSAKLLPQTAEKCWGHGAAFTLAMGMARTVVARIRSESSKVQ